MKKTISALALASLILSPVPAFSASAKEPTGEARKAQYLKALAICRKNWGGQSGSAGVTVYWGANYGKTGWWCRHY